MVDRIKPPSDAYFPPPANAPQGKPHAGMTKNDYNDTVNGLTTNASLSSPDAKKHFEEHEIKELGNQMKEDREQIKQQEQKQKETELGG